jgi:hypothetical protein
VRGHQSHDLDVRDAMPHDGNIDQRSANVTLRAALQHRFGMLVPGRRGEHAGARDGVPGISSAYGGRRPSAGSRRRRGCRSLPVRCARCWWSDDDDAVRDLAVQYVGARYSTDELASSGLGSPMRSLLDKPFTLPELTSFIEEAFLTEHEEAV